MIKFTIGCGKRCWPGWVHVDGNGMPHLQHHDVSLKYQPDNYIDLIYSSHFIGYFSRGEIVELLSNWFNKLKPGGTLRLATPDFNILSKMYQVGVELDKLIGPIFGEMYMDEVKIWHKTTYDEISLNNLLVDGGFVNVRRYDHTKTDHPNSGNREDFYDDHSAAYINGTLISLNIEANKPL